MIDGNQNVAGLELALDGLRQLRAILTHPA